MFSKSSFALKFFLALSLGICISASAQEKKNPTDQPNAREFIVVQIEKLDGEVFQLAVKDGEMAVYRNDAEGVYWGFSASLISSSTKEADLRVFELTGKLTNPEQGPEVASLTGPIGFKTYIEDGSAPSLTITQITSDPFEVLRRTNASCRPMPSENNLQLTNCCVVCNGDMVCACAVGGGCGSCCGSCC